MTIIAVKHGTMAADSASFTGSRREQSMRPKLYQRADGAIVGCAGAATSCHDMIDWFMGGEHEVSKPVLPQVEGELEALVLRPDGRVYRCSEDLRYYEVGNLYAVGETTASAMTMGAMHAGATAREAVQIAINNTIYVGGEVQALSIK